jgi:hypothetical protein
MQNIKQIVAQTKINMGYNAMAISNYTYNVNFKLPITLNNLHDIKQLFTFYQNVKCQEFNEDYFGFECAFRPLLNEYSAPKEVYDDYLYQIKCKIDKNFEIQINKALTNSQFKYEDVFELLGINEAEANNENLYFHLIFRLKITPKVFFRKLIIEKLLLLDKV